MSRHGKEIGGDDRGHGRITISSHHQREAGDQVNRFQLCALVSGSAKRIKASADRAGEPLPLAAVVRAVLRCYRLVAKDQHGPLAGKEPDIAALRNLDQKIFKEEITHHSGARVKSSETRLAGAEQLHDESKIKAERDGLRHAIEVRDRWARELR